MTECQFIKYLILNTADASFSIVHHPDVPHLGGGGKRARPEVQEGNDASRDILRRVRRGRMERAYAEGVSAAQGRQRDRVGAKVGELAVEIGKC